MSGPVVSSSNIDADAAEQKRVLRYAKISHESDSDTDGFVSLQDYSADDEEAIGFVIVDPDEDSDKELPANVSDFVPNVFTNSLRLKTFVSNPHGFTGTIKKPKKGELVLCTSLNCVKDGQHVPLNNRKPLFQNDSDFQQTLRANFKVDPNADWVCASCLNECASQRWQAARESAVHLSQQPASRPTHANAIHYLERIVEDPSTPAVVARICSNLQGLMEGEILRSENFESNVDNMKQRRR